MPVSEFIGREHPAFVHLPIAASLLLVASLGLWIRRGEAGWKPASRLLAWAALLGGLGAALSGLFFARSLDLLPPAGFFPARPGLFPMHEALPLSGLIPGLAALVLIERRSPRAAFVMALAWASLWGAAGHWGGRMVFPDAGVDAGAAQTLLIPEAPWATSASPKSS